MKKVLRTLLCLFTLILLTNVSSSIAEERLVTYKPLRYVQGTVTDKSTGAKLSGVKVQANGTETTTNSNGEYKIQLTVNSAQLTFTKNGYQEYTCQVSGIQVNETKTKDVKLVIINGTIKGVVSNANDSTQKLSGVTVKCGDKTTTTNSQGEYSFTVQPGTYTLKFSKSGFNDASQSATVTSNATKTVNCSMTARNGTIKGVVSNAGNSTQKLSGVTVKCGDKTTTTNSQGEYSFTVQPGTYTLKFSKSGFNDASQSATVTSDTTKTVNCSMTACNGTIKGVVSNAIDPTQKLSGVTVKCGDKTTTTNSQGEYSFTVQPGTYTLKFSKSGFNDASQSATVTSNATKTVNCSMSEILSSTECRVVLTWGETPNDIDSHLFIKKGSAESHVWFVDKEPSGVDAKLDVDDVNSYGPETTTFTVSTNGVYRFSVLDYTNNSRGTASQLSSSNAKVVVYYGSNTYEFPVPSNCGSNQYYWYVFKIENGVLKRVNTLGTRDGDSF